MRESLEAACRMREALFSKQNITNSTFISTMPNQARKKKVSWSRQRVLLKRGSVQTFLGFWTETFPKIDGIERDYIKGEYMQDDLRAPRGGFLNAVLAFPHISRKRGGDGVDVSVSFVFFFDTLSDPIPSSNPPFVLSRSPTQLLQAIP